MDSIKCRIYSKEGEEMLSWEDLLASPDFHEFMEHAENNVEDGYYSPLMLFTGHRTKTKTEIYVGDIVAPAMINKKERYVVSWSIQSAGFYLVPLEKYGVSEVGFRLFVTGAGYAPFEVVGHIYQPAFAKYRQGCL